MAVATKAAAFGVMLRFFDVALIDAQRDWGPAMAALATITIVVGNVGALGQSSLKRLMAGRRSAQAGYMLAGVVVATRLGVQATVFYLAVYLFMNLAAFGVIVARERATGVGDDIRAVAGLGADQPLLAAAMTLAMLGLAGIPATAGFIGKFYLIDAAVDGDYTWLGVVIVIGSMVSLAYYLRVIAAMWMQAPEPAEAVPVSPATGRPALAGGDADRRRAARAAGGLVRVAALRRGDAVLRDHPVAAVRPGGPRRVRAGEHLLSARLPTGARGCLPRDAARVFRLPVLAAALSVLAVVAALAGAVGGRLGGRAGARSGPPLRRCPGPPGARSSRGWTGRSRPAPCARVCAAARSAG